MVGVMSHDVAVVGAGLVGLSVARSLADARPGLSMAVIDKESEVAAHQSSHNSGVLHSGLYYAPGSLKARLCVEGRREVLARCGEWDVPHRISGKLVIATRSQDVPVLDELERRGRANGLTGLRRLDSSRISDHEPEAVGRAALLVPEAGVVDFPALARHTADSLRRDGIELHLGASVGAIEPREGFVTIHLEDTSLQARVVVNCAGLHSDRIAALAGIDPPVRIVPFRGEYYRLRAEASRLVRALVYPVPDPRFPFLGVHFTRRIDGTVEVGPNAVLALGREHYRGAHWSPSDLREMVGTPALWRLARRHWRYGVKELWNSRSKRRYAAQARALIPVIGPDDLLAGASGVRAQAVAPDGRLVDDFVIERTDNAVHVLNAPSPAATASPAIGRYVAREVLALLAR